MAYLLLNGDENTLINKVGESIYIRNYPLKYNQKSNIIGKSLSNDYSASIDENKNIHMVYKTSSNNILHLEGIESGFTGNTILEDTNNAYQITNLNFVSDKKNYLFYCAMNPYESTADLIFHDFQEQGASPQSLLSLPCLHSKYQCFINKGYIKLLCCIHEESSYFLNLYSYHMLSSKWEAFETLIASDYPITDFCFFMQEEQIHISYVIEKYGHFTLYYGQKRDNDIISLEVTALGQKIQPVIFSYNNILWINYLTAKNLHACFSSNGGESFSSPLKCTLQNSSIEEIYIFGCEDKALYGNCFFGFIDTQPNICVLSQIDVDNILFYSNRNQELREVLKTGYQVPRSIGKEKQVEELEEEILYLREMQKNITNQYNELANFTTEVQAEGKKWRKKYQRLFRETREMKEVKEAKEIKGNKEFETAEVETLEVENIEPEE